MAWLWMISVGVTDVQFPAWKRDDCGQWQEFRFRRERGGVRQVHEGLLALLDLGRIDFPDRLPQDLKRDEESALSLVFEQEGDVLVAGISGRDGYQIAQQGNEILKEAKLPLFCPKVADVLGAARATFGEEPVTVVALQTRRAETLRDSPDEPIGSGPLVAKYLAERMGLCWQPGGPEPAILEPGIVTWLDILTGEEAMEDASAQRALVHRLTRLIRAWNPEDERRIALTPAGGMPPLKPLIERVPAICLGQDAVRLLDIPERRTTEARVAALDYGARVAEQETLRFYCAEALRQGRFIAAYGFAGGTMAWAPRVRKLLGPFLGLPATGSPLMFQGRTLHRFEIGAGQMEMRLQASDAVGAALALRPLLEAATWFLMCRAPVLSAAGLKPNPDNESVDGPWPANLATAANIAQLLDRDPNQLRNRHKVKRLLGEVLDWLRANADPGPHGNEVAALVALRDAYYAGNPSLRQCRNAFAHGAGERITPEAVANSFTSAGFQIGQPFGENFLQRTPVADLLSRIGSGRLEVFLRGELQRVLEKVIEG